MKMLRIIFIILLIAENFNAQSNDLYLSCVKDYYRYLYADSIISVYDFSTVYANASPDYEAEIRLKKGQNSDYQELFKQISSHSDILESSILLDMRNYKENLTQGLSYENICKLIDSSFVYDEGIEFSMFVEISFLDGSGIYFEINKDTPRQIQYIWLSNGESLGNLIQGDKEIELLQRPGIINDPDGYTNIREKPEINSKVVGRLTINDIFYYTPTRNNNWWPVSYRFGEKPSGYIHRSRIKVFKDFPIELKEKIKKQRSGC